MSDSLFPSDQPEQQESVTLGATCIHDDGDTNTCLTEEILNPFTNIDNGKEEIQVHAFHREFHTRGNDEVINEYTSTLERAEPCLDNGQDDEFIKDNVYEDNSLHNKILACHANDAHGVFEPNVSIQELGMLENSEKLLENERYDSNSDAEWYENSISSENREVNATNMCNMESPMLFIHTEPSGKMVVNEEAVHYLSDISDGVYVVAIAGKYRTGKSYIMNRFFNTNQGFELGSTVQSKTKGIWIWARPHPQNRDKTLVLLDTEGLCDVQKADEEHDMKLFSLAILLSTSLVYNAMGTLDEVIVQQLHLVSELTEHIQTTAGQAEEGDDFHKYFPSFFLLLRDFFLEIRIDGKDCTPTEYMEHAFKLKTGNSKKTQAYNEPRSCITRYFPQRECFTLCKPVEGEEKLRHLESLTDDEIRPEFLEQVTTATGIILSKTGSFRLNDSIVNGSQFVTLAKEYVSMINSGAIPSISGAVESLRLAECTKAMEEAKHIYDHEVDSSITKEGGFPIEHDILIGIQEEAYFIAERIFIRQSIFDDDKIFFNKFKEEIEKSGYIKENENQSEAICKELLKTCFEPIDQNIKLGSYNQSGGLSLYLKHREASLSKYNNHPKKGPMAQISLSQWLENRGSEENAIRLADKAATEHEEKMRDMKNKSDDQERKFNEAISAQRRLENDLQVVKVNSENKIEGMKEHVSDLKDDLKMERRRVDQVSEQHLREIQQIRRVDQVSEQHLRAKDQRVWQLESQNEKQQETINTLHFQLSCAEEELEQEKAARRSDTSTEDESEDPPSYYCYEGHGISRTPPKPLALTWRNK